VFTLVAVGAAALGGWWLLGDALSRLAADAGH
jgi:hypothetical protein